MTRAFLALALCLLPGCYNGVDERPANAAELAAIGALRAVYHPGTECESLEQNRFFVWTAPQRRIADYCTGGRSDRGIIACRTGTYAAGIFASATRANISWDSGWNVHHRLIIHEAAHSLSACLGRGVDRRHEHRDLWDDGEANAAALFFAEYPIPADAADDPYTRAQRDPWDLTGTRYEGRDCDYQPHAWLHHFPWCVDASVGASAAPLRDPMTDADIEARCEAMP